VYCEHFCNIINKMTIAEKIYKKLALIT